MVFHAARIARRFLQGRAAIRHRLRRPKTLEGHAQRIEPQIAFLLIPCGFGQLHHGSLQSQRRRRLHKLVRATSNRPSKSESRRKQEIVDPLLICSGAALDFVRRLKKCPPPNAKTTASGEAASTPRPTRTSTPSSAPSRSTAACSPTKSPSTAPGPKPSSPSASSPSTKFN